MLNLRISETVADNYIFSVEIRVQFKFKSVRKMICVTTRTVAMVIGLSLLGLLRWDVLKCYHTDTITTVKD